MRQNQQGGDSRRGIRKIVDRIRGNISDSWKPWLFLAIIILYGVFYPHKIPFVWDRSLEENMNIFLSKVEGTNPYPLERVVENNGVYDKNVILPDMVYEMGYPKYYVYVYTMDKKVDEKFNKYVLEFEKKKSEVPVFRLYEGDLIKEKKYDWVDGRPKIIEMVRVGTTAVEMGKYMSPDQWKDRWKWDVNSESKKENK